MSSNSFPTLTLFGDEPMAARDGNIGLRFKGVVSHPNGHWGAQIYANHQRIWLGTFKTELEAALAYDRAANKLRTHDSYHNIALEYKKALLEADFQSRLSVDDVLGMIKDGSYDSHLAEFQRKLYDCTSIGKSTTDGTKMFEKVLTKSDVGKLNRLVIPKKSAIKFQQRLLENGKEGDGEMEIEFFDNEMKCWLFRFRYWKSSNSFVFTKGWSRFVKGKNLKEGDVVVFNMCLRKGQDKETTFFTIDVQRNLLTHINVESKMMNRVVNDLKPINSNRVRLFGVEIA